MKTTRLTGTLCALSLLLLAGCAAKGTVMGSVIEGSSNRPVVDAKIMLTPVDGDETQTAKMEYGGNFVVHVKEGDYQLSVEHESLKLCDPPPAVMTVSGGMIKRTQVCLEKATGTPAPASSTN